MDIDELIFWIFLASAFIYLYKGYTPKNRR